MELLLIYIASILTSAFFQTINKFKIFKSLADKGYVLDFEQLKNNKEDLSSSINYITVIPIVNVLYEIYRMLDFHFNGNSYVDSLIENNYTKKMSAFELDEYNKKPTGINIILAMSKYSQMLKSSYYYKDEQGLANDSINFIYDEYGLKIINRTGRFLYMNHDDLEKYIYTNLIPFIKPNSNIIIKPKEIEVPHLKDKKLEEDINNYFNNLKDNLDKVDEQPKIRTLSKRK
ncbi:MAG TPA: hypothetical protein PLB45_02805 [Bacilli bacterium]|jgi:hypothetical protein|nr:hypothetical protein [Bacilli bacterium]HQC83783.1 hypothetical protein [Bacilli bacterium]